LTYAIDRYVRETARLYSVLNKQLSNRKFIAQDYSIADMACYPWIVMHEKQRQNLDDFQHIKRWFSEIKERPAVQRAYAKANGIKVPQFLTETAKQILYNQNANQ
jgi:GST-like protein